MEDRSDVYMERWIIGEYHPSIFTLLRRHMAAEQPKKPSIDNDWGCLLVTMAGIACMVCITAYMIARLFVPNNS